MTPLVREATKDDLPALLALLAQLSPDDPDREDLSDMGVYERAFERMRVTPGQHLLVAEDGGRIVGTLVLVVVPNLSHKGSPYGIIENVVVDGAERSKGYGEAMISRAIDLAREAGCYKVSLTSNKRRGDAHRFYGRLGFAATHEGFRVDL